MVNETDPVGMRRLADEHSDRMTPHLADLPRTEWTADELTVSIMTRKAVYNKMWRFTRTYDRLLTRRSACRHSRPACRA